MFGPFQILISVFVGIVAGFFASYYEYYSFLFTIADTISILFINLLKLVSLPIIFLSIVSTATGMKDVEEIKIIGKKVITYSLLTTFLAASVALLLFVIVNPAEGALFAECVTEDMPQKASYVSYLIGVIPSNIVLPFAENNVIGILFLAALLSFASLSLEADQRLTLHAFFSSLYAAIMKVTTYVIALMPFGICAFVTLFIRDLLQNKLQIESIAWYLFCVIAANAIQALIVLPLFLKWHGISPLLAAKKMLPALSVAFFSKSSNAALPMAMRCAERDLQVSQKVASFSLPLCTTINMNACAGFILTTVLFVAMSHGVAFSSLELLLWVFIASMAAVGNAGVPMGCYFLASSLLVSMNVPLHILGIILPFYSIIDMFESAVNVWSDSCVTLVVDKEKSTRKFTYPIPFQRLWLWLKYS